MPFRPEELEDSFLETGFRRFRRLFLRIDLAAIAGDGAGGPAAPDHRLEPWTGSGYDEPARLILDAYRLHIDSHINDQYRSLAGAIRFLHNIAHYPGCGKFDPACSLMARAREDGSLQGMMLVSRVRPDVAHITQICVNPERQNQGLGRALIARGLRLLRQHGLRAATLTVTRDNAPARSLYARLGFATLREFDAYVWEKPGYGWSPGPAQGPSQRPAQGREP